MDHFLAIGGITIAVRCIDARVHCDWTGPLSRFLVPPLDFLDLDLVAGAVVPPRHGDAQLVFDSGSVWRMFHDARGYRIECSSEAFGAQPYKVATIDDSFAHGRIDFREDMLDLALNPLDYPLDEVLIANLLGRGRGVELHSCGVIDRAGRGHLFVGVSGAGKTTTARLWGEDADAIVSDDRVIVREHDGVMWMYGTPWHGEAELSVARRAPLAGVYLLTQSTDNELRPLASATAAARLFACTFPLFHDGAALAFTLEFLARIAAAVPVRELRFRKDRAAVDLVLAASA